MMENFNKEYSSQPLNKSKLVFIFNILFVIFSALLLSRIYLLSHINFSWPLTILLSFILISTIFLPFTLKSFEFKEKSFKKFIFKYGLVSLIPYGFLLIYAGIFFISFLFSGGDGYVLLPAFGALFGALFLLKLQILYTIIIVFWKGVNYLKNKYLILLIGLLFLSVMFVLSFNVEKIPGTEANKKTNSYYGQSAKKLGNTQLCDLINLDSLNSQDLINAGCNSFYMFDENGEAKYPYKQVAPINAFRSCAYIEKDKDIEFERIFIIDCNKLDLYSDKEIKYFGSDIVPEKYIEEYGFSRDAYYFDVCKVILEDVVEKKIRECKERVN